MRLNTTYHLLGSTSLVLILAAPYMVLAERGDPVRSSSDTAAANYGRAGGQAYFSTAQPPRTPQALVNAYETTKGYVEHAYDQSKEFLIASAQGHASQELAAENGASRHGDVDTRQPVTSGGSIGAYGREGVRTYWSTVQPTEPPQVLTDAYEKTKGFVKHTYEKTRDFLTEAPRHSASERPTPLNGA